ncbi:MAG: hypothetical protein H7A48_06655 [Akkermansiaceae bacterium]|nr:hypothetical protein [Akkermansiaceae bacterium]MCP5547431.1 hypothetical protein [Akkermansiaceae bacterium]
MKAAIPPVIAVLFAARAFAGPTETAIDIPAAGRSAWEFRLEAYAWLTGMDGRTGVSPLVADISPSFSDLIDHINMAAALQFEARRGRWGIIADGFYADLGLDGSTPGPVFDDIHVGVKQYIGEFTLAYRIYESPRAFVDVYGGVRYNDLSLEMRANLEPAGITSVGDQVADLVFDGLEERAGAITSARVQAFRTAGAARRSEIEAALRAKIEAEAETLVKQDLARHLHDRASEVRARLEESVARRISRAVKQERAQLARATARLEIARLRRDANRLRRSGTRMAGPADAVSQAENQVRQAEQALATAVSNAITANVPTRGTGDEQWFDPILGMRARWDLTDKWFLSGKTDIGGFGVGSDFAWSLQGTVGHRFTDRVSAEFGYRYLDTDYQNGSFVYDVAEMGFYTGLNIEF